MDYLSQRLVLPLLLAGLLAASETAGQIVVAGTNLVELRADHPSAMTGNWVNTGSLGGSFQARGDPVVTHIDGVTYVSMDGDDYYFGPPASREVTDARTRSIEVWARNDFLDPRETLVAWGARGDVRDAMPRNMAFHYGSNAEFGAANHGRDFPQYAIGWNAVPAAGQLHYLVYTYDGTTARVYADGVERNSQDIVLMTRDDAPFPFLLHAEFDGLPMIYPGPGPSGLDIAVVRIDTGVLSPSDIAANFKAGVARFPLVRAEYFGLVTNGSPNTFNEGPLSLFLLANGLFTAKLTIGGATYSFSGTFAPDGTSAPIRLERTSPPGPLMLVFAVDVSRPALQITGTLTDGNFTSAVTLDRALFDENSNPAPSNLVGNYTAFLRSTSVGAGIPQGTGFARVCVNTAGNVRAVGVLADGRKFSQGATLTGDGTWPFFAALYKTNGLVAGFIDYGAVPGESDLRGTLDWVRPPGARDPFAAGFSTEVDFSASHYSAPPRGQRALDLPNTSPNGRFITPIMTRLATLTVENRIIIAKPNPEKVTLKLKVKTGVLSGRVTFGGKARNVSGILQLEQNQGAGFFLTESESLPFTLGN